MTNVTWTQAKNDLKKLGIAINTRVKSCEAGCACVGDEWLDKTTQPRMWQTGKRFGAYGGYLNHSEFTDEQKWQIMATLNASGVRWSWDGLDHHTIRIDL